MFRCACLTVWLLFRRLRCSGRAKLDRASVANRWSCHIALSPYRQTTLAPYGNTITLAYGRTAQPAPNLSYLRSGFASRFAFLNRQRFSLSIRKAKCVGEGGRTARNAELGQSSLR